MLLLGCRGDAIGRRHSDKEKTLEIANEAIANGSLHFSRPRSILYECTQLNRIISEQPTSCTKPTVHHANRAPCPAVHHRTVLSETRGFLVLFLSPSCFGLGLESLPLAAVFLSTSQRQASASWFFQASQTTPVERRQRGCRDPLPGLAVWEV